ncbi:xylulokinase [Mycobacterium antarcticum]|uniref:xylulokinase n=1 Tax=unclassified Mycolicibacterium TaxID=2636767 RepID=UPI0023845031|nr:MULTISPECIES: FGGY family carbohydrate kinase [unclassified Mycolicibacterium]BDX30154.1 xylulokinase [Mycolicibacterium sp. TUM20985]GLP73612.1 xylulokinase [Mycolicibacterium sp. TUM20983]
MTQHFLAFDVGTSGVKVVVVDEDGRLLESAYRPYGLVMVADGGVEQDLGPIIDAALDAARDVIGRVGTAITGISVTAQMFNVVAVDVSGRPLAPMISWLDQRAEGAAAALAKIMPPNEQFKRLHSVVSGKDIVPKISWLRDERPDVYAASAKILDCKEAVVMHLTGVAVTDHAGASAYRLYDQSTRDWNAEACDATGIDVAKLPKVCGGTDVAGYLRPDVTRLLGLTGDVPVYVGVGDVPASQLGSGAIDPGDLHVSLGTAVYFGLVMPEPKIDPRGRLGALAHADPDLWILWLEIATGGAALAWAVRLLGLDDPPPVDYARVEQLVRDSADDMDGLLFAPWLSGERVPVFDDSVRASFVGLSLHHGPGHVLRAVMEGVAFQMRWALEYAMDYGQAVTRIRAVGGGTMGSEWIQIIADILERPLETIDQPQDAAAIGAAACAIVGSGAQSDFSFLTGRATVTRCHVPDAARALDYSERYVHYRRLYEALHPIYHP